MTILALKTSGRPYYASKPLRRSSLFVIHEASSLPQATNPPAGKKNQGTKWLSKKFSLLEVDY